MIGTFEIQRPDLNLPECVINISLLTQATDLFLCKPDFQFNSLSDFANRTAWNNAIAQKYIFPIHNIIDVIDQTEDIVMAESRQNFRYQSRQGKYRFSFVLNCDVEYYAKLVEYAGQNLKLYLSDLNNNLIGVRVVNAVKPLDIENISIRKIPFATSSPSLTQIIIDLYDPNQVKSLYAINPTFDPGELTNTEITMSVTSGGSILFESDFSQWTGTQYADYRPVGFTIVGQDNQNYISNDSNRGRMTITNTGAGSALAIRRTDTVVNGDYIVSFDIVETDITLTIEDYIGGIHPFNTAGSKSVSFTVSDNSIQSFIELEASVFSAGHAIVDNFKIERVANTTLIVEATDPYSNLVTGLVQADFSISDSISGSVNITGFEETSIGVYEITTDETFNAGTVTMLSSKYNSIETYDFT